MSIPSSLIIERVEELDDPRLDEYRDLKRTNATRQDHYLIAEGRLVVERLLASSFPVRSVLLSDKRWQAFAPYLPAGTRVLRVSHELCSRLVGFDFHAGVMASADRVPRCRIESELLAAPDSLLVCCPATHLPDNLGSIVRLAAAFQAQGLIVGPGSADPFSRRVVRVSMGTIFQLPVIEPPDLVAELKQLRTRHGVHIVAAGRRQGAIPLRSLSRQPRCRRVVLLGNEASGLSDDWYQWADQVVEIEMSSSVDSLNVAAAAAILLYELAGK